MGLTLDMNYRSVYWIVRSYEGSSLFRAITADELKMGEEIRPEKVSSLQYPNMQGKNIRNIYYIVRNLLLLYES